MKKIFCLVCYVIISASFLSADAFSSFSNLVQFDATVSSLVKNPQSLDSAKLYIVEGMITSVRIINPDPANYLAEVEFFGAEWNGYESITSYKILLIFNKPVFSELLVAKSSQNLANGQFGPNSRGLALLQPSSSGSTNNKLAAFTVHGFRILN